MNSIEPKSEAAILAEKEGEAVQLYQICRLRAMPAAPAGSPVPCDGSSRAPGAAHRPAEWRGWPRSGRRGAATAQEPAALRPAKLHLEVPAAEEGWVDSAWTGARGCRGMQIGPRRVLGTLPPPVFRQPDVTRLHGSDRPGRPSGRFSAKPLQGPLDCCLISFCRETGENVNRRPKCCIDRVSLFQLYR